MCKHWKLITGNISLVSFVIYVLVKFLLFLETYIIIGYAFKNPFLKKIIVTLATLHIVDGVGGKHMAFIVLVKLGKDWDHERRGKPQKSSFIMAVPLRGGRPLRKKCFFNFKYICM